LAARLASPDWTTIANLSGPFFPDPGDPREPKSAREAALSIFDCAAIAKMRGRKMIIQRPLDPENGTDTLLEKYKSKYSTDMWVYFE